MTIRNMTLSDLKRALEWAAREGWNPGLDDAEAFFAADPEGYFVNEIDGQIAAVISVVNHSDSFAFLGLYICDPAFRGQGHGMTVWNAAVAHAGDRCIGLDGVADQQDNYRKSGFVLAGETVRYQGQLADQPKDGTLSPVDLPSLVALDAKLCGVARTDFASAWYQDTPTRKTFAYSNAGTITAYATARKCAEGLKIGPLWAEDLKGVSSLLAEIGQHFEPRQVQIDVQTGSEPLAAYLQDIGFEAVFGTARMYTGPQPSADPGRIYAPATLELG